LNNLLTKYTAGADYSQELFRRILDKYSRLYPEHFNFVDESINVSAVPVKGTSIKPERKRRCLAVRRNGQRCQYKATLGHYCGIHTDRHSN